MDFLTRMMLLAGAFMNICALAYLLGIAYIAPLAFSGVVVRQQSMLLLMSIVIVVSTLLSWFLFNRHQAIASLVFMYAWWVVGIWFINSLIASL